MTISGLVTKDQNHKVKKKNFREGSGLSCKVPTANTVRNVMNTKRKIAAGFKRNFLEERTKRNHEFKGVFSCAAISEFAS